LVQPTAEPPGVPPEAYSSLHLACVYGLHGVAKEMLRGGADVNARDKENCSPLHWAAVNNRREFCEMLVNANADPDARGRENQTPLHWAALQGHFSICHFLVEAGASINARDDFGFTPFLRAAQGNYGPVVVLLKTKGCDIYAMDHQGHNALHWSSHFGLSSLTSKLLLMMHDRRNSGNDVEMQSIDAPDHEGNTALHIAAKHGNWPIISRLLLHGASLSVKNKAGDDPDQMALKHVGNGTDWWMRWFRRVPALLCFLQQDDKNPAMMLFAVASITLAYVHYFTVLATNTPGHFACHLVLLILTPFMWWSYYKAVRGNPGFVKEEPNVIEDMAIGRIAIDSVCLTCVNVKPPRSKHCRMCGHCVYEMDHHCGWINNCVGKSNRIFFLGFVTSCCVCLSAWGVINLAYCLDRVPAPDSNADWRIAPLLRFTAVAAAMPWPFFLQIFFLLYTIFTFAISMQLISGIVMNMTTNERINWQRYPMFRKADGTFSNRYDKGYLGNCKEFFVNSLKEDHQARYAPIQTHDFPPELRLQTV